VYAAETGFKLASNPDHVRAPDAAFIRRERLEQLGEVEGFWPGAPDLVVEVVSPSDTFLEVQDKVFDWLDAGCRMVVVVTPRKRAVTVYRSLSDVKVLGEADVLDGADVVPGWRLPVKDLFG
jgi:Uma2 family endonuclease